MENYEKEQPVAFGGQYDCVAPVPLRGLILTLLILGPRLSGGDRLRWGV